MPELEDIRADIDKLDEELIKILAKRIELTRYVRDYKKQHNLSALSPDRWQQLTKKHKKIASEMGVDYRLIEPIFDCIHKYVLNNVHKDLSKSN